jgi:hypothetical protein
MLSRVPAGPALTRNAHCKTIWSRTSVDGNPNLTGRKTSYSVALPRLLFASTAMAIHPSADSVSGIGVLGLRALGGSYPAAFAHGAAKLWNVARVLLESR